MEIEHFLDLADMQARRGPGAARAAATGPEPFDRRRGHAARSIDHNIQFRRALYSVPTRYIGQALEVRAIAPRPPPTMAT